METISELIAHPELLTKDTLYGLRELVAKYPYYQAARLLFLKNLFLLHDAHFGEELRKAALFLPDRRVLFAMVEGGNYEIQPESFRRDEETVHNDDRDRTQSLIDDFLREANEETASDTPRRKLTVADATTDYAAFLLDMEDAKPDDKTHRTSDEVSDTLTRSEALIDDFIENKPERFKLQETPEYTPELPPAQDGSDEVTDEGYLTMTLAKIYIKQQRYEKALEIMRKVSINNPKKSSYFADQIRFLRKLIINKKHQNQ